MPDPRTYTSANLTRITAKPPTFYGYTPMAWLKFYGMIALLWCVIAWSCIHYFGLFDDLENKPADVQQFLFWFTSLPLLFALPVVLLFLWWAAGALVRYARWQLAQPALWRWFWMLVLMFYGYVVFDPLDAIHPQMSRKGLAPMVNFGVLIDRWHDLAQAKQLWPPPLFQFQWGYFLLWFMLWFLVIALHWQYFLDFLREAWFYARRFQRYGVSVLTGFSETGRLARSTPVTRDYPRERPNLPPVYRGVPRLNVPHLTPAEARAILAADSSGALLLAPQQDSVLFVDLGSYDFSPALAELKRADGTALLKFSADWPLPDTRREALVIPLADPKSGTQQPSVVRSPQSAEHGRTIPESSSVQGAKSAGSSDAEATALSAVSETEHTAADRGPGTADNSPAGAPDSGRQTPQDGGEAAV